MLITVIAIVAAFCAGYAIGERHGLKNGVQRGIQAATGPYYDCKVHSNKLEKALPRLQEFCAYAFDVSNCFAHGDACIKPLEWMLVDLELLIEAFRKKQHQIEDGVGENL
jgi:hypothetical protein